MRNAILAVAVVVLSAISLSAQTTTYSYSMSWDLVTSSSQNCRGCINNALESNRPHINTVINTLVDHVYQPSDLEVLASFICYFNAPNAGNYRHEQASRFIELAKTNRLDRLTLEVIELYIASDIGSSSTRLASHKAPRTLTTEERLNKNAKELFGFNGKLDKKVIAEIEATVAKYEGKKTPAKTSGDSAIDIASDY